MAKGVGLISTFRGKMGNTVMYRIRDAATQETQGLRVYQPQVSNPQTDYQLDQRIKMAAVNNCYRALKPLIDRGFEGVDYGNLSRREFMKLALTNPYSGPYIVKGSTTPYPVLSPISKGSLPEISGVIAADYSYSTNIVVSEGDAETVDEVSSALIAAGYLAGDQVTIVVCFRRDANSPIVNRWGSFYIDESDTRSILDVVPEVESYVKGGQWALYMDEPELLGAAVIVSREGSHLRSTARFAIAPNAVGFSELYTAAAASPARASYRRAAARSTSDWEEDPQTEGESVGTFTVQGITITGTTVSGGLTYLTTNGAALACIHVSWERSPAYNKYIVGKQFVADSLAADFPIAASETIELGTGTDGDLTEIESQFVNWLIDKCGYDWRLLTVRIPT